MTKKLLKPEYELKLIYKDEAVIVWDEQLKKLIKNKHGTKQRGSAGVEPLIYCTRTGILLAVSQP